MKPLYARAARALIKKDPPVTLSKVNRIENKKLTSRFSISSVPTLRWFANGKDSLYGGGQGYEDILHWVMKRSGPQAYEELICDDIDKTVKENKLNAIYFGE